MISPESYAESAAGGDELDQQLKQIESQLATLRGDLVNAKTTLRAEREELEASGGATRPQDHNPDRDASTTTPMNDVEATSSAPNSPNFAHAFLPEMNDEPSESPEYLEIRPALLEVDAREEMPETSELLEASLPDDQSHDEPSESPEYLEIRPALLEVDAREEMPEDLMPSEALSDEGETAPIEMDVPDASGFTLMVDSREALPQDLVDQGAFQTVVASKKEASDDDFMLAVGSLVEDIVESPNEGMEAFPGRTLFDMDDPSTEWGLPIPGESVEDSSSSSLRQAIPSAWDAVVGAKPEVFSVPAHPFTLLEGNGLHPESNINRDASTSSESSISDRLLARRVLRSKRGESSVDWKARRKSIKTAKLLATRHQDEQVNDIAEKQVMDFADEQAELQTISYSDRLRHFRGVRAQVDNRKDDLETARRLRKRAHMLAFTRRSSALSAEESSLADLGAIGERLTLPVDEEFLGILPSAVSIGANTGYEDSCTVVDYSEYIASVEEKRQAAYQAAMDGAKGMLERRQRRLQMRINKLGARRALRSQKIQAITQLRMSSWKEHTLIPLHMSDGSLLFSFDLSLSEGGLSSKSDDGQKTLSSHPTFITDMSSEDERDSQVSVKAPIPEPDSFQVEDVSSAMALGSMTPPRQQQRQQQMAASSDPDSSPRTLEPPSVVQEPLPSTSDSTPSGLSNSETTLTGRSTEPKVAASKALPVDSSPKAPVVSTTGPPQPIQLPRVRYVKRIRIIED